MDEQINRINILGFGSMAKQIAALFFLGGYDITIWSRSKPGDTDLSLHISLLKRSLSLDGRGNIRITHQIDSLPNATTIECVVEDLQVKQALFAGLHPRLTYPYFTNSSSFSPTEIGHRVNALHFFNPISIKVVELFKWSNDHDPEVDKIRSFLTGAGYETVDAQDNRGFLGNLLLFQEISNVCKLIELKKYPTAAIRTMYDKLYGGRDIFSIVDQIGIDVARSIMLNLSERDKALYVPACLDAAIKRNILGKKNKTSIRQVLP
jgi:3-hydroxyacyl-CoA dehydrogenase